MSVDNRKDIFLLLLYLPGKSIENNEPISGRTRLMKLIYLLDKVKKIPKALGVRYYYGFEAYDYGPFSKDVYDDIEFLSNVGLINITYSGESSEADQIEENLFSMDISIPREEKDSLLREEHFSLTKRGREFVEKQLISSLNESIKDKIIAIKQVEGAMPLSVLLRYVYSRFPESAVNSTLTHLIEA